MAGLLCTRLDAWRHPPFTLRRGAGSEPRAAGKRDEHQPHTAPIPSSMDRCFWAEEASGEGSVTLSIPTPPNWNKASPNSKCCKKGKWHSLVLQHSTFIHTEPHQEAPTGCPLPYMGQTQRCGDTKPTVALLYANNTHGKLTPNKKYLRCENMGFRDPEKICIERGRGYLSPLVTGRPRCKCEWCTESLSFFKGELKKGRHFSDSNC